MRPTWKSALVTGALASSGLWVLGDHSASAQSIPGTIVPPPDTRGSYPYPASPAFVPGGDSASYSSTPAITPPTRGTSPSYAGPSMKLTAPSRMASPAYAGPSMNVAAPSRLASPAYAGPSMNVAAPSRVATSTAPVSTPPIPSAVAPSATTPTAGRSAGPQYTSAVYSVYGGAPSSNAPQTSLTSYSPAASTNPTPAHAETARRPHAPSGSAFASDTRPWPTQAPAKRPSALRRWWNRVTDADKESGADNKHAYIDPSTGRTDLPLSKPWLKQIW